MTKLNLNKLYLLVLLLTILLTLPRCSRSTETIQSTLSFHPPEDFPTDECPQAMTDDCLELREHQPITPQKPRPQGQRERE